MPRESDSYLLIEVTPFEAYVHTSWTDLRHCKIKEVTNYRYINNSIILNYGPLLTFHHAFINCCRIYPGSEITRITFIRNDGTMVPGIDYHEMSICSISSYCRETDSYRVLAASLTTPAKEERSLKSRQGSFSTLARIISTQIPQVYLQYISYSVANMVYLWLHKMKGIGRETCKFFLSSATSTQSCNRTAITLIHRLEYLQARIKAIKNMLFRRIRRDRHDELSGSSPVCKAALIGRDGLLKFKPRDNSYALLTMPPPPTNTPLALVPGYEGNPGPGPLGINVHIVRRERILLTREIA
ncbi:uncharacterized protein H6S33_002832 [Morchella sextelata]|uniref:uncharacterized protein n=1 Tax=Morchella sextelata TaxID=1174677 RepID=UPI001D04BE8B|nr:uncharacterized protein H6S33_002832 [Morchella sextelata]KAH0607798.1 hypothetical protein H6S33_002832 [Morchella sextelata]